MSAAILSSFMKTRTGTGTGNFFPDEKVASPQLDSRFRGNECARKGRYISMVKVHAGVCHNSVAEGNCVAARRGGEQPEANCRSVGGRTRFSVVLRRASDSMVKPGSSPIR